jgi:hypothetical protein
LFPAGENLAKRILKFSVEYWLTESDDSRKDAKHAKLGEAGKYFFFALLASWREKIS